MRVIFRSRGNTWRSWRVTPVAPRNANDAVFRRIISSSWRVAPLAPRNVNDASCVATIKHACRRSIVLCIPEVAPRNVLDVSCVATIKRTSMG